jgi:hypothetical protein
LGANDKEVITVRTDLKMKLKFRKYDCSGTYSADTISVVSEPEAKLYRVSFHNRRRLDDFDSATSAI